MISSFAKLLQLTWDMHEVVSLCKNLIAMSRLRLRGPPVIPDARQTEKSATRFCQHASRPNFPESPFLFACEENEHLCVT